MHKCKLVFELKSRFRREILLPVALKSQTETELSSGQNLILDLWVIWTLLQHLQPNTVNEINAFQHRDNQASY